MASPKGPLHLSALTTYAGVAASVEPTEAQRSRCRPPSPAGSAAARVVPWEDEGCSGRETLQGFEHVGEGGQRSKGNRRPGDRRGRHGFHEKEQDACAFVLPCQRGGEESSWMKLLAGRPWLLSTPPPAPSFSEEFDGRREGSHPLGPSPSTMAVTELEMSCLDVKSSEVKSL